MRDPGSANIKQVEFDSYDHDHNLSSIETPLRGDAFKLDDEIKIELIENKFKDILLSADPPSGLSNNNEFNASKRDR